MRKTFAAVLSALAAWLLLLSMALLGVFICTTSRSFYAYEYEKYGQAETIGISDEGLMRVTNALLDYLWGTRDTLDMQAEIGGQLREVFTQREKDHMVDVRNLVMLARTVMVAAFVAGASLFVLAYFLGKKQKGGVRAAGIGYLAGAGSLVLGTAAIVFLAMQDFTGVFIRFHEIFFTNDLWLLNADDMLIQIVPEPFFADCAALIAAVFGVGAAATVALAIVMVVRDSLSRKGRGDDGEPKDDWDIRSVGGREKGYFRIDRPADAQERPDAREIFARMGLNDNDEEDEEETLPLERLRDLAPRHEAAVPAPTASPLADDPPTVHRPARFSGDFPTHLEDRDLSVRLEMKLDLRVERSADGELTLTMDPDKKPEITLRSRPGRLDLTVEDAPGLSAGEPVALSQSEEKPAAPADAAPETWEGADAVPVGPKRPVEPAPSPEELLKQMDELMKGFPQNGKEEERR
ncbi:MAG: TIGR01906 family membrane protein [Candidatus Spyradocola sp.]|jgi:integral membrane protein (TIGR01906 family)